MSRAAARLALVALVASCGAGADENTVTSWNGADAVGDGVGTDGAVGDSGGATDGAAGDSGGPGDSGAPGDTGGPLADAAGDGGGVADSAGDGGVVADSAGDGGVVADSAGDGGVVADSAGDGGGVAVTDGSGSGDAPTGDDTAGSPDVVSGCAGDAPIVPFEGPGSILWMQLGAADGKAIAANLYEGAAKPCTPAVLLVHQFQQSQAQWGELPSQLQAAGLIVLTIDLRGHGESDPQDGPLAGLLSDPDQAPLDVAAGVDFLASLKSVDPGRIAVVGTSIGANLSVVAQIQSPSIRAIVPISPRDTAIEALSGQAPPWALSRVLCLATEDDGAGAQAATCQALVAGATEPAKATVWPGSAHGIAILADIPEAAPAVIGWLLDTL